MGCENTVFSDLQKDFQQVAHLKKPLPKHWKCFFCGRRMNSEKYFAIFTTTKSVTLFFCVIPPPQKKTKKRKCPIFVLLLRDRSVGLGRRRHFSRQSYRRFPQKKGEKRKLVQFTFGFFLSHFLTSRLLAAGAQTTDTNQKKAAGVVSFHFSPLGGR